MESIYLLVKDKRMVGYILISYVSLINFIGHNFWFVLNHKSHDPDKNINGKYII